MGRAALHRIRGSIPPGSNLMTRRGVRGLILLPGLLAVAVAVGSGVARPQAEARLSPTAADDREAIGRFVNLYCVECHNHEDRAAGVALDGLIGDDPGRDSAAWEKVVRKLVARQMPPAGSIRPSGRATDAIVGPHRRVARPRGRREARPRPDRHLPPAHSGRVSERHPRPPGPRHRRLGTPAARRIEPRVRQPDGRRPLADAPGSLHQRRPEDQPPGRGGRRPIPRRRHDPGPGRPHAGRARRGAADRHAGRGAHPLHLPPGRRVRGPDPIDEGPQRACRGPP